MQTSDLEQILSVLSHPDVTPGFFAGLVEDYRAFAQMMLEQPETFVILMPTPDSLFIFQRWNTIAWLVHDIVLPTASGFTAYRAAVSAVKQFFDSKPEAKKIIGHTPSWNQRAVRFAVSAGMNVEGILWESTEKNGQMYDIIITGMTREEAKELGPYGRIRRKQNGR